VIVPVPFRRPEMYSAATVLDSNAVTSPSSAAMFQTICDGLTAPLMSPVLFVHDVTTPFSGMTDAIGYCLSVMTVNEQTVCIASSRMVMGV
jgi:hypothetical protein